MSVMKIIVIAILLALVASIPIGRFLYQVREIDVAGKRYLKSNDTVMEISNLNISNFGLISMNWRVSRADKSKGTYCGTFMINWLGFGMLTIFVPA